MSKLYIVTGYDSWNLKEVTKTFNDKHLAREYMLHLTNPKLEIVERA